jgi:hypothetical protein
LIDAQAALTGLAAWCFSPICFETVTSGETGLDAGAEGATAPETLRQTDPRDFDSIWKETPEGFGPEASADGIILSGTATDGASTGFRELVPDETAGAL